MTEVELAQACAQAMYARDQATQGLGFQQADAQALARHACACRYAPT